VSDDEEPEEPVEPEEPPTNTWVAERGTAWSAAYAMTVLEMRGLRYRLFAVVVLVGLPTLLAAAAHGGTAFGLLLGLVLAVFLLVSMTLISTWGRQRHFRTVLPPGLVLTSQFYDDHLVLRRQWTATAVEFRAYDRLDVVDVWVFLRQRGRRRRVRALYPLALMPPDDLARLRLTILGLVPEQPEDDQ
jgi:hypothetical protein